MVVYSIYLLEVEGLTHSPVYVGRTKLMPEHRFYLHNSLFHLWERRGRKAYKCSSYDLFDIARTLNKKVIMSVLEVADNYTVSKERERVWFHRLEACRVNKNTPNRRANEYIKDNWEQVKKKMYEYRNKNISSYKRTQQEWRERNRDKIKETNRMNYLKRKKNRMRLD